MLRQVGEQFELFRCQPDFIAAARHAELLTVDHQIAAGVIGFGSSGAIAAAYGIAVTLTMIITVLLLYVVLLVTDRKGMALWREKLFVLMSRNAVRATVYFRLPPERVVELGVQVEM